MKISKYKIKDSDAKLTSRSGSILFAEYLQKKGVIDNISALLPQSGSNRGYSPEYYLVPLFMMLHIGGSNIKDIGLISQDTGLLKLLGVERLPDHSSVGDWIRRLGERDDGLFRLNDLNKIILANILRHIKEQSLILDIDATAIEANKREAVMTYKGFKGYLPILGHIAEACGAIIGDEFREGNTAPCADNLEFIKYCCSCLPSDKHFGFFRADSASYQADIINYCQANGMKFGIGGKMSKSLKEAIDLVREDEWIQYTDRYDVNTDSQIVRIPWCMGETDERFFMIVKRTPLKDMTLFDGQYEYSLVATNRTDNIQDIMQWYNHRGHYSENKIKELKHGFGMNGLPFGTFKANGVFFRIGVCAYNLFILFKLDALPQRFRKSQIQTIRLYIYQIPAKVVCTARQFVLKVPMRSYELFNEIQRAIADIPIIS